MALSPTELALSEEESREVERIECDIDQHLRQEKKRRGKSFILCNGTTFHIKINRPKPSIYVWEEVRRRYNLVGWSGINKARDVVSSGYNVVLTR